MARLGADTPTTWAVTTPAVAAVIDRHECVAFAIRGREVMLAVGIVVQAMQRRAAGAGGAHHRQPDHLRALVGVMEAVHKGREFAGMRREMMELSIRIVDA